MNVFFFFTKTDCFNKYHKIRYVFQNTSNEIRYEKNQITILKDKKI